MHKSHSIPFVTQLSLRQQQHRNGHIITIGSMWHWPTIFSNKTHVVLRTRYLCYLPASGQVLAVARNFFSITPFGKFITRRLHHQLREVWVLVVGPLVLLRLLPQLLRVVDPSVVGGAPHRGADYRDQVPNQCRQRNPSVYRGVCHCKRLPWWYWSERGWCFVLAPCYCCSCW